MLKSELERNKETMKKKNTRAQGHKIEALYRDILQKLGYQVSPAPKKLLWIKGRPVVSDADYYKVFDIISYNPQHWRLSQVTHWESSSQYPRMNKIIDHISAYPVPENTLIEVVAWRGGRKKLDKRYENKKGDKHYVPHQIFYVYSLVFNKFKETARISKTGELQWQLKGFYHE